MYKNKISLARIKKITMPNDKVQLAFSLSQGSVARTLVHKISSFNTSLNPHEVSFLRETCCTIAIALKRFESFRKREDKYERV